MAPSRSATFVMQLSRLLPALLALSLVVGAAHATEPAPSPLPFDTFAAGDALAPVSWEGDEATLQADVGMLWLREGRQLASFGALRSGSALAPRPYAYWIGESDAARLGDLAAALESLGLDPQVVDATCATHWDTLRLASGWRALGAYRSERGDWRLFAVR